MLLADSTILIDLSRGNEAAILFCDNQRRKGEGMALSIISSMELIIGCRDKGDLNRALKLYQMPESSSNLGRRKLMLIKLPMPGTRSTNKTRPQSFHVPKVSSERRS
jgi:hypothetical protein